MAGTPVRFLHAADFHLERLPEGVEEIPAHLRDTFVECPYRAATRVFDTAIAERVDFLVLAGDVLHVPTAGLRGPMFLVDQFRRLGDHGIAVYWAGGKVDRPAHWIKEISLPKNVTLFGTDRVEAVHHQRHGETVACVAGLSRKSGAAPRLADFQPDPGGAFTIGVLHANATKEELEAQKLHYWALGGEHQRQMLFKGPHTAHVAGTPQGRAREETGPHGCTLVEALPDGRAQLTVRPTDVLRWHEETVHVEEDAGREHLENLLTQRMQSLREATPELDLLVSWRVTGRGPLIRQLKRGSLCEELLAALRRKFGFGPPAAWSLALEIVPPDAWPDSWYAEETLLGDFLRSVRDLAAHREKPLELEGLLPAGPVGQTLAGLLRIDDESERQRLLREVESLGIELLAGPAARSER